MDYEKLYRDTINNLQQMVNSGKITAEIARGICADFVPEGDDERIRKEIITYLSTVEDKELIPYEPWIAWLKKQGEHANFRNKIQIGDKVTRNEDGVLVNLSQLKRVAKPADKVKPKFKVGDWVVRGKTIAQILDIQEQYYIGLDIDGTDFTSSKFLSDDKIHLWAIDDAKAGDVLVTDSGRPFIFKGCLDKIHPNNPVAYCGIDSGDDFYECSGINWWTDENVYPATQEQRDLLFQKMKEAGYEWDADKKELKKIEQKPWSDEDEKIFEHIIAKATLHFSSINYLDEEEINFLKSLKDRVQPQPRQEWKQENTGDLTDFENAMMHIGGSFFGQHAGLDPNDTNAIKKQANLLLELIPKQELSEEDEQYLLVCKNALRKYQVTDKWDSNIISQWLDNKLKSLRPQNRWKPSDGQIKACKEVYADILSAKGFDLGTINSELNRLEEKLKKHLEE